MSLTILPQKTDNLLRSAWPLWLLLILLAAGGVALWLYWPQILLQSIGWQRGLNQQMTALLQQVEIQRQRAGWALVGFSLVYGVLHAVGPGHGKVVIATFLATHPTKIKTSLQLTLAAAVVQGGVAILLVSIILVVLQLSSRQLHLSSYWLEKGSYLLVVGLGIWLCVRALRKLWRVLRPAAPKILSIHTVDHVHSADCGCGHQHVPDNTLLAKAVGWKTKVLVVFSMGLRPCSGAIMMLLFSRVIGVYAWGVLSAVIMALGTAFTVSAMALFVQVSRAVAVRISRDRPTSGWQKVGIQSLALVGGVALIMIGIMLYLSAQPMISNGIRGAL
ncbi:nickel/cobalt transporter [Paramixta manurensis]|uniref:Nickel/cobalt efflux system n=1 Tax=Paramixta manurensis TaxID=2740817 RepID=A0A6M8UEM9_9GAMM|nr:nickel/cobalt transporter [Erwiniaceae bacterium PD-1]